jgi:hypothetical protein
MKRTLITILVGVVIAVASWVPLWIVEARDPYAIPFELGLLTFAASFVGGAVAFVAFIRLVIHAARASRTPAISPSRAHDAKDPLG